MVLLTLASCGNGVLRTDVEEDGQGGAPGTGGGGSPPAIAYDPLRVEGEDEGANFGDPSLEYSVDGRTGWLAYTDVEGDAFPIGPYHHINIAMSDDAGDSWTLIGRVLNSVEGTITTPNGDVIKGVWAYEVPSLVHVPDDTQAPWKLFAHRYFRTEGERRAEFGWITITTAQSPMGPWTEAEPFLGTALTPFAPFATRLNAADLDPALADLVALSEPGSLYHEGVLYLSLTGLLPDGPEQIFLLASEDFGETWRFVSTLLTKADGGSIGAARFDASSLVEVGGRVFLMASPERDGLIHDGTSIFEFEDIALGALRRTGIAPIELAHIPVQTDPTRGDNRGGGQSDYDEHNTKGGVLFHQVDADNRPGPIIQVFNTRRTLSEL